MSASIPGITGSGKTFWHASVERMPAIMSSSEVFDSERMTSPRPRLPEGPGG